MVSNLLPNTTNNTNPPPSSISFVFLLTADHKQPRTPLTVVRSKTQPPPGTRRTISTISTLLCMTKRHQQQPRFPVIVVKKQSASSISLLPRNATHAPSTIVLSAARSRTQLTNLTLLKPTITFAFFFVLSSLPRRKEGEKQPFVIPEHPKQPLELGLLDPTAPPSFFCFCYSIIANSHGTPFGYGFVEKTKRTTTT